MSSIRDSLTEPEFVAANGGFDNEGYACPVFCSVSKTTMLRLETMQNKLFRMVTNSDRYIRLTELRELADIQTIEEFIRQKSDKFYRHLFFLESDTSARAHHDRPSKHGLIYQALDIFHEIPEDEQ